MKNEIIAMPRFGNKEPEFKAPGYSEIVTIFLVSLGALLVLLAITLIIT